MAPSEVSIFHWSPEYTLEYLQNQQWADDDFCKAVKKHKLDGLGLTKLTKADLLEMGVEELGDRFRILKELKALQPDQKDNVATLLADIASSYSFDEIEKRFQGLEGRAADMHSADSALTVVDQRQDLGFEISPISSLLTPRKTSRSGVSSATTPRRADHLDGGSTTPFRGRAMKELLATEGGFGENTDFLAAAGSGRGALVLSKGSSVKATANPSAEPRKHSSQKKTELFANKQLFDTSLGKTKAMMSREAKENHERMERLRQEEALRKKEGNAVQQKLRAAFQFVDVDEGGVITNDEVMQILEICYPTWGLMKLTEVTEAIMDECDHDKSQTLSMDEFLSSKFALDIATPGLLHAERVARKSFLEEIFAQVDNNGDGFIKEYEMMKLVKLMFPGMAQEGLQDYCTEIMKEADKSGDGIITLDELLESQYANLLAKPKEAEEIDKARKERLAAVFREFDTDGTEALEAAELKKCIRAALPEHPEKSIDSYTDLIMVECDVDGTGSVSLDEFVNSTYSNMLAGIQEEELYRSPFQHSTLLSEEAEAGAGLALGQKKKRKTVNRPKSGEGPQINSLGAIKMVEEEEVREQDKGPSAPAHLKSKEDQAEDAELAKKRQAQELLFQNTAMSGTNLKKPGMGIGVLEKERRYTQMTNLFNKWDEATDPSIEGSKFIEEDDLIKVVAAFFEWSDDEVEWRSRALLQGRDLNGDGMLDWEEFVAFVTALTDHVSPAEFDVITKYLHHAIGDVSEEVEDGRRNRLIDKLFDFWDYDESRTIDSGEFERVLQRYQGMGEGNSNWINLAMTKADQNQDGKLQPDEFRHFMKNLTSGLNADDFDFMYFRMYRAVENVQFMQDANRAQIRYRRMMENQLASEDVQAMVDRSKPVLPMVLYGTSIDPARVVEKVAANAKAQLEPCMVSHMKGATGALSEIRKKGFRRGYWIFVTLDQGFDGLDWFLRQVGVELQTNTGKMAPKFRLFIHAPFEAITSFPHVLMVNAISLNLDDVFPNTKNGPAAPKPEEPVSMVRVVEPRE